MATRWNVSVHKRAERELRVLFDNEETGILKDAFALMLELEEDHCPAGCVPPENAWDLYRGRIAGNYRIVYRVFSEAKENPHHSHSTPKHRVRGALKQTNAGWARFHPPPNHTPVTADCGGQNDVLVA